MVCFDSYPFFSQTKQIFCALIYESPILIKLFLKMTLKKTPKKSMVFLLEQTPTLMELGAQKSKQLFPDIVKATGNVSIPTEIFLKVTVETFQNAYCVHCILNKFRLSYI